MSEHTKTITVNLSCLSEPPRAFPFALDPAHTVLDLLLALTRFDDKLRLYSLMLPQSGLVSPRHLRDTLHGQLRGDQLDVKIYPPITYRNSFNFINNLLGLHEHNLLDTTNLMDVEPINHAKLGEWIGFGRGPTTIPPEENNRIQNLIWVIYNNDKPVCYNVHALYKVYEMGPGTLLLPHLNLRLQPDKFLAACVHQEPFRVLRVSDADVVAATA